MKWALIFLAGAIIVGAGFWAAAWVKSTISDDGQEQITPAQISPESTPAPTVSLEGITVYPANGSKLSQSPEEVSVYFPQSIAGEVNISLAEGGRAIKTPAPPEYRDANRTITLKLPADLSESEYVVTYNVCFDSENQSCVRGEFNFSIGGRQ